MVQFFCLQVSTIYTKSVFRLLSCILRPCLGLLGLPSRMVTDWVAFPFLTVLAPGSPRSRCWQGWLFLRGISKESDPGFSPWLADATLLLPLHMAAPLCLRSPGVAFVEISSSCKNTDRIRSN